MELVLCHSRLFVASDHLGMGWWRDLHKGERHKRKFLNHGARSIADHERMYIGKIVDLRSGLVGTCISKQRELSRPPERSTVSDSIAILCERKL